MADITASMVKELREKTGVGMMDAKKALVECNGNMEEAVDHLRAKGLAKAAKKSGRVAAEGLVAVSSYNDGKGACVVEVNAETDFVARNEQFQSIVFKIADNAAKVDDVEQLASSDIDGKSVNDNLTELIATIGENMSLRRMAKLEVPNGIVASYIHGALVPNAGKIGVLVALETEGNADAIQGVGKQIAMHIAATNPEFLDTASVSEEAAEREKSVLREQALASGKPAEIVEKMIEGRMRKYYEEVCLTEQIFVIDGETKIKQVIENAAKEAGAPVKLTGYVRFALGEGIEKEENDFAAEVAAAVNG